jgi:hypothetical protein
MSDQHGEKIRSKNKYAQHTLTYIKGNETTAALSAVAIPI